MEALQLEEENENLHLTPHVTIFWQNNQQSEYVVHCCALVGGEGMTISRRQAISGLSGEPFEAQKRPSSR